MTRMLLAISVAPLALLLGCFKADVQVPDYGNWGQSPQPAVVTPANPNDKADLIRENTELRNSVAWYENQNSRQAHKYKDLADDMTKVREKRDQYARERDQYKAAAGKGGGGND